MSRVLDGLSWLITVQPIVTLIVLLLVTLGLGAGVTRLAPQAPNTKFLPKDSTVASASGKIGTVFGDPNPSVVATILFRGSPLTPRGLAQIDRVVRDVEAHVQVAPLLAAPVISPTQPLAAELGATDFASLSQGEIDAVVTGSRDLDRLVDFDQDGTQVALAFARLRGDVPKAQLSAAQFAIHDIA